MKGHSHDPFESAFKAVQTLHTQQGSLLQRACACGGLAESDGECSECRNRRLASLQSEQSSSSRQRENILAPPASLNYNFSKMALTAPAASSSMKVNQPGDAYEQEANQIAERIVQASTPVSPAGSSVTGKKDLDDRLLRRKENSSGQIAAAVPSIVHEVLQNSGRPLDATARSFMEPRFGHDFSRIRIHTDERAEEAAEAVNALAYTVGQDIFFGRSQYAPGTGEGKRLLAHELTHTIQQSSSVERSPLVQRQDASATTTPPAVPGQLTPDQIADTLYNALDASHDTYNNENALKILQDHAPLGQDIQSSFQKNHQRTLRGYLKERLYGDQQVKAFALLNSPHALGQDTAMALALISRFHYEEVFHILEHELVAGRQVMEKHYNETFGKKSNDDQDYIGQGTLKDDLKASTFHSWVPQKSIAMLDHDLTSAEILYFDSVGIVGTHTDEVVNRIQSEWSKGPANFAAFARDWDNYVCNQNNWWKEKEPWTKMGLYEAMSDELSGEPWKLVSAVLTGYEEYKKNVSANLNYLPTNQQLVGLLQQGTGQPVSEDELFKQEDILLGVAEKSLKASEGIVSDDTTQLYKAIGDIQRIWEQRIQRVEAALKVAQDTQDAQKIQIYTPKVQTYKDQWEQKQKELKAGYAAKGTEDGESRHVLLMLAGGLNMADEVYLAGQNGERNEERVMSLLISYWAQGKMTELLQQTCKAREDANHNVLRPAFDVTLTVPTASETLRKIIVITKEGVDDAVRGSGLLKYELDKGDSDGELKRGYDLLNTSGLGGTLRNAVVQHFMLTTGTPVEEEKYVDGFISHISTRYHNSNTVWLFKDLLQPSTDPKEMLARARGRKAAADKGFISWFTQGSPEDLEAQESIDRLALIAKEHQASTEEIQGMIAMAGINPSDPKALEQLAGMEYKAFQERLDELRATRAMIVEVVTTIAQLVAEAVVTVATGGAALPMLLASLGATAASIVAHKLLLPPDEYEVMTLQNAEQMALVVAAAGFGALGESVSKAVISAERAQQLGRAGAFLQSAVKEAQTKLGTLTVQAMFEQQAPTPEGLAATAISLLGASAASGIHGSLSLSVHEELPDIQAMRRIILADSAKNLVDGISNQAADMARNGVGNLSGGEIAQKLALDAGKNLSTGFVRSAAAIKAQGIAAVRQKKQDEAENKDDLGDTAHDPNKLPAGQQSVTAPGAVVKKGPQTVTVAQVNEEHTLSVVQHPDGEAVITLCSPVCGRLRQLLEAVQQRLKNGPGASQDVQDEVNQRLAEAALLENELRNKVPEPGSPEKQKLEALAAGVRVLLGKVGEKNLFGTKEGDDVRSALPALSDQEIKDEAKSQSLLARKPENSPIVRLLDSTNIPDDLQAAIRQEISDALTLHSVARTLKSDGSPDTEKDDLWRLIADLESLVNKKNMPEDQRLGSIRGTLAELRRINRLVMSGSAASPVVNGASPGVDYPLVNPQTGQTVTVRIDPVKEADALYLGNDGKVHLEEVKANAGLFRKKVSGNANQFNNLKSWAGRTPAGEPERVIAVIIDSAADWSQIALPLGGNHANSPIRLLIDAQVSIVIGGIKLEPDQLRKLDTAVLQMRAADSVSDEGAFLASLPPLDKMNLS